MKRPRSSGSARCIRNLLARIIAALAPVLVLGMTASAYDLHFDYTSFDNPGSPGASPHFGQAQFNVLNYPSINGNYMMTSTDNHRPEMVANGNNLAQFYNNFNADYNKNPRPTATQEADAIHAYTTFYSTRNGPRPTWLILNEISASLWPQNPGDPSLNAHRQWVIDCVTRLNDVYGYSVVTYAPFATVGTANGPSWQALAEKSYIGIENYLSGPEVLAGGTDYASRVAWAQAQYQASMNTYTAVGVPESRLFLGEHFANNTAGNGWGRAGISAADWDTVIQIRQDAIFNVGFPGFLAYSWGGNGMGITEPEQIQHEYYYRTRRVLASQQPQWLSDSAINVNGTVIALSWSQPLNWLGGVPNANGAVANFWRTLTANRTITLDGSKTIGTLTFDSLFSYTINAGTGGSLIFNNSASDATLVSNQGNHNIGAAVQLSSDLNAAINAGTFTINGNVSGPGGLTKTGTGSLLLNGINSYVGDTAVQAGKLRLNDDFLADSSDVFLAAGATLELQFTGNPDVIASLFIDGVAQSTGIWGAVGSGAAYITPLIMGTGLLQVTVGPLLVGDYNSDGIVDAADYVVWRFNVGAPTIPNRDPNNSGPVGLADYNSMRAHFGETAGSGSENTNLATVPEPAMLLLATWGWVLLNGPLWRCRRRAAEF